MTPIRKPEKGTFNRTRYLCVPLAGALVAAAVCTAPAQATPSTVGSTILATAPVAPLDLHAVGQTLAGGTWGVLVLSRGKSDGYVVDNKFAPGTTTGWHSHPGPSLIFVVSGTVTDYESSRPWCAPRSYSAGSSFVDEGGSDVHMLANNGSVPAETIAVQLIPAGQPRRIDKPEPANCHV